MITLIDKNLEQQIGDKNPCFIICEIGQNHNGDINLAKKLIKCCKEAGADCVKFQKTNIDTKFTKLRLDKLYNSENSYGRTYGEHKKFLEFTDEEFKELQLYSHEIGIMFTASAMDIISCKFLNKINVPFIKIGSGDNTNLKIIEYAAQTGKPVILSTGMSNMEDVEKSVNTFLKYSNKLCLLQCTSFYPCKSNNINLNIIDTYKNEFLNAIIGYSNHSPNPAIIIAAVAKGAKIVEMHVTLDKNMKGSDHKASLNIQELTECIKNIKEVENSLGSFNKTFLNCEKECFNKLGKWLVFNKKLEKGYKIQINDIDVKVTYKKGIIPNRLYEIIGKTLKKNVLDEEIIELNNLI